MDVCCAAGAPVSIDYTPQGSLQKLGGVNCYVTGDSKNVAIIGIYDIFGFSAQVSAACSMHRASTDANAVALACITRRSCCFTHHTLHVTWCCCCPQPRACSCCM
jgi:hypothetical protein